MGAGKYQPQAILIVSCNTTICGWTDPSIWCDEPLPLGQIIMLVFIKVLALLLLYMGHVFARNGCRQCTGTHILNFKDYATLVQVEEYLSGTLGKCATGHQYEVNSWTASDCSVTDSQCCKNWDILVRVWRYCGNGGSVFLDQSNVCDGNRCTLYDRLVLTCKQSVDCRSKCDCKACGCR